MKTTKGLVWLGAVLFLGACGGSSSGGGGATTGGGGDSTSGGETASASEPVSCSVPNAPESATYQQGAHLVEAGDPSGVAMLETACTASNPCACSELAEVYWEGTLATADRTRAIALSDQACTGGEPFGCFHAGAYRWLGQPDDLATAASRFAAACDDNHAESCLALARLEQSELGGLSDTDAVAHLDTACQHDSPLACYYQGEALSFGMSVEANPQRGAELLEFACLEAHVPSACTTMGNIVATVNPDAARTAYQHACELHDPFGCDALAENAAAQQGTSAASLDVAGTGIAHTAVTASTDAATVSVTAGGDVDLSTLGLRPSCTGLVARAPDAVLDVAAGTPGLDLLLHANADTTLAVRDPAGNWHCADDIPGGSFHPRIEIQTPATGAWAVWAGSLATGEVAGTLVVNPDDVDAAE